MKPDAVHKIVDVVARATDMAPSLRSTIEKALRNEFAGQRLFVPTAPRQYLTIEEVNEQLRRRMSVRDIAQSSGVSRQTIYRMLKPKTKVTPQAMPET